MESFPDSTPLWDLSHASNFSQIPDDDFLNLLQKQFPPGATVNSYNEFTESINPQNISRYSLPSLTPPSEDSSPSPPNFQDSIHDDSNDPALKRKASDDDFQEGPSQKNPHTSHSQMSGSRRKSTGSGHSKDETRLLKRKEQNRAAQRAFRERKEKHVKDLEDKVAALEAKNEQATSENDNLRDLLSRLQNENMMLKQGNFTFSMPKNSASNGVDVGRGTRPFATESPVFPPSSSSRQPSRIGSPPSSHGAVPKQVNPLDWSSLTSFDPNVLQLLDDGPQQTATDGAMHMDFGFGGPKGLSSHQQYTTIASNPMFMSYVSTFDNLQSPPQPSRSPNQSQSSQSNNGYGFEMGQLSRWPTPGNAQEGGSLDDLFPGYPSGSGNSVEFPYVHSSPASISPIAHSTKGNVSQRSEPSGSPVASSSSSPSSISDAMFGSVTPGDSVSSDSDAGQDNTRCPKTKAELEKRIAADGYSTFTSTNPVRKSSDEILGSMITCKGTSSLPKTQKNDSNVEVLSAWRSITSNPKFKDVDINDLCREFTSKARCDGTKVVLEPQGVHSILENLAKRQ